MVSFDAGIWLHFYLLFGHFGGGLSSQQYKLLIHTLKLSPCEMKLGAEHFHELQIIVFVLMCRVL